MSAENGPPGSDVRRAGVRLQAYLGRPHPPWREAWQQALYGPTGFYRRPEGPAGHFRTAGHAAPGLLAAALARLAVAAGCTAVLDVGAGRGELLTALAGLGAPASRLALHGCDVVGRPPCLPATVGWSAGLHALPDGALDGALVVGWELLDVVPCTVVEVDAAGVVRTVLVERATGAETLGPPVGDLDAAWLDRWWPLAGAPAGARAEVGGPRDELWADLASRCAATERGAVLLAVDYAHSQGDRPASGSLVGYRAGRRVPPVPDGSADLTAHVALDAVAAASEATGAGAPVVVRQREALRALGIGAADQAGAAGRPGTTVDLLRALAVRSAAAELLDPDGLGGFSWLLQGVRRPAPRLL